MRGGNLEDLDAAADAIRSDSPSWIRVDAAAWYNKALCLAWAGENLVSIACLDRVVALEAETAFDDAVAAWTLAEVLRQGGGAETLADDLRFACTIAWDPGDTPRLLHEFPEIRQLPHAARREPRPTMIRRSRCSNGSIVRSGRPIPFHRTARRLPMVLASVFIKGDSLRLSSPRAENLEQDRGAAFPAGWSVTRSRFAARRRLLPFPFLDADLWIFRIPSGVDSEPGGRAHPRGDRALFRERMDSPEAKRARRPIAPGRGTRRRAW